MRCDEDPSTDQQHVCALDRREDSQTAHQAHPVHHRRHGRLQDTTMEWQSSDVYEKRQGLVVIMHAYIW